MFKETKRFIAGAVCPRCSEMDKLRVFSVGGVDYRDCVSCGFREEMHLQSAQRELETRVNKTTEEKAAETQPIKFVN